MKVLYLVPPGRCADQITPHSFLDEEIEGLARTGIEPYVLSKSEHPAEKRGRIHVEEVGPGRWTERAQVPMLFAQYSSSIHRGSFSGLRRAFHSLRLELEAAKLIRAEDIDLVHSHFGCAFGFGGMVAARETGRPLVASFRGMDLLLDRSMNYGLRREPSYDKAVHALLRDADFTTYATGFMRSVGIAMGAPEERAVRIRKGVDLERFSVRGDAAAVREKLGLKRPTILTVADLIPRKGVDDILHAVSGLAETHDFELVVCGDGPEEEALRGLAASLGLSERVRFTGQVGRSEIPDYFAACDMFILASHLEAAGNVLLEAMASGRPVICTESGGPPEYVQDGVSGLTVPPADVPSMARGIRSLLDDPALAERLGRTGREIAERDHAYDQMVGKYVDVYRRALGTSRGSGLRASAASGPGPNGRGRSEGASPGSTASRAETAETASTTRGSASSGSASSGSASSGSASTGSASTGAAGS